MEKHLKQKAGRSLYVFYCQHIPLMAKIQRSLSLNTFCHLYLFLGGGCTSRQPPHSRLFAKVQEPKHFILKKKAFSHSGIELKSFQSSDFHQSKCLTKWNFKAYNDVKQSAPVLDLTQVHMGNVVHNCSSQKA